jgi:hypothetical protein
MAPSEVAETRAGLVLQQVVLIRLQGAGQVLQQVVLIKLQGAGQVPQLVQKVLFEWLLLVLVLVALQEDDKERVRSEQVVNCQNIAPCRYLEAFAISRTFLTGVGIHALHYCFSTVTQSSVAVLGQRVQPVQN